MKFIEVEGIRDGEPSRPARGAWIEMPVRPVGRGGGAVAPRKGRVD